jgi:hypothetical protein
LSSTLKIEAAGSSETSISTYQTTFHENLLSGSISELSFGDISPCITAELHRRFEKKTLRHHEGPRSSCLHLFLIGIVGGGVLLGPLGTAATNRPIVPAPGDYDDGEICGMMIGRGNRSTLRKPAPVPRYPPQTPHTLPELEPGPPRWEASD